MTDKERFMKYANKRLKEKEYKRRRFVSDLNDIQLTGVERCSRKGWRRGQP